jgi:hypothetical protein
MCGKCVTYYFLASSTDVQFLPISGLLGANMKTRMDKRTCRWWSGPCLFEIMDCIEVPLRDPKGPVRYDFITYRKSNLTVCTCPYVRMACTWSNGFLQRQFANGIPLEYETMPLNMNWCHAPKAMHCMVHEPLHVVFWLLLLPCYAEYSWLYANNSVPEWMWRITFSLITTSFYPCSINLVEPTICYWNNWNYISSTVCKQLSAWVNVTHYIFITSFYLGSINLVESTNCYWNNWITTSALQW